MMDEMSTALADSWPASELSAFLLVRQRQTEIGAITVTGSAGRG